jgi:hypothetical protein
MERKNERERRPDKIKAQLLRRVGLGDARAERKAKPENNKKKTLLAC